MNNITLVEAMNFFEYIEKNTKIPSYEIEGWKVWPIFRVNLSFNLTVKNNENIKQDRIKTLLKKPKAVLYYGYSCIRLLELLYGKNNNCDVVVRTSSDLRRDFLDKKYKDVIFDDLIQNMPNTRFFIMEDLGYNFKRFKPFTRIDIFSEGWRILYRLRKLEINPDEIEKIKKDIINELLEIKKKGKFIAEIEKTIKYMENRFSTRIVDFFKIKSFFLDIFKKTNPKIFLTTCTYGYEGMNAAAKELKIPIVDVLHGMMHKYHHGYIFGKHLKKYEKQFPVADYIFTQNKPSTDIFLKHTFWDRKKVKTIGNLRVDYWGKRIENNHKIFRNVFFGLEGEDSEIIELAEKTMEILKNKNIDVKFSLKMHPGERLFLENLEKLKQRFPENIQIIDAEALNLYEYISKSDVNVTIGSTIHFEAISLHKPTIMAGIKEWRYLGDLVKEGSAKLAKTPEELAELIIHVLNRDKFYLAWMKKVVNNSKKYQEKDSINKGVYELNQILNIVQ